MAKKDEKKYDENGHSEASRRYERPFSSYQRTNNEGDETEYGELGRLAGAYADLDGKTVNERAYCHNEELFEESECILNYDEYCEWSNTGAVNTGPTEIRKFRYGYGIKAGSEIEGQDGLTLVSSHFIPVIDHGDHWCVAEERDMNIIYSLMYLPPPIALLVFLDAEWEHGKGAEHYHPNKYEGMAEVYRIFFRWWDSSMSMIKPGTIAETITHKSRRLYSNAAMTRDVMCTVTPEDRERLAKYQRMLYQLLSDNENGGKILTFVVEAKNVKDANAAWGHGSAFRRDVNRIRKKTLETQKNIKVGDSVYIPQCRLRRDLKPVPLASR